MSTGSSVEKPSERPQPERDIAAHDHTYFREDAFRRLDAISQYALAIWKGLMIVNGGAIIALFTLISAGSVKLNGAPLWWAFASFGLGVALTLFSNLAAYICQSSYMRQGAQTAWNALEHMHDRPGRWEPDKEYRMGAIWEYIALGAAGLALVCFVAGSWLALEAGLAGTV